MIDFNIRLMLAVLIIMSTFQHISKLTSSCLSVCQEENDVGDFFLSLDKDPQQEEFLQGRMQGNPYPSSTPGLGPLMRDVKNKICTGIVLY